MTKRDLISFYRNSLPAPDKTGKYHPQIISYAVRMAYEQLLYDMYLINPKNLDEYVVTLNDLAVVKGDRDYITLDKSFIKLPGKGSGVRSVHTVFLPAALSDIDDVYFFPMTLQEYEQAQNSDMWATGEAVGYAVGQGKIYLHNLPVDWDYLSGSVSADIVQSFEEYADTDEVMMPHGQAERLTELVVQYLGKIPPKNLLNNNSDQNG
jgi:hypothetical protein